MQIAKCVIKLEQTLQTFRILFSESHLGGTCCSNYNVLYAKSKASGIEKLGRLELKERHLELAVENL